MPTDNKKTEGPANPWKNREYSKTAEKYQKYGGYPQSTGQSTVGAELIKGGSGRAAESEGEKFFSDWYSNPETKARLKDQLGLSDKQVDQAISHALDAEQEEVHEHQLEGRGEYDPGGHKITTTNTKEGKDALPHELVHATGLDTALGDILQEKIGKAEEGYLGNSAELYGNFVDIRQLLKLEPGDWVTPEFIQARMQENGIDESHPDFEQLLNHYSIEQISEGLDNIASIEADQSRLEKLNIDPSDAIITRNNSLYT